jgi:hypothetical protein
VVLAMVRSKGSREKKGPSTARAPHGQVSLNDGSLPAFYAQTETIGREKALVARPIPIPPAADEQIRPRRTRPQAAAIASCGGNSQERAPLNAPFSRLAISSSEFRFPSWSLGTPKGSCNTEALYNE